MMDIDYLMISTIIGAIIGGILYGVVGVWILGFSVAIILDTYFEWKKKH